MKHSSKSYKRHHRLLAGPFHAAVDVSMPTSYPPRYITSRETYCCGVVRQLILQFTATLSDIWFGVWIEGCGMKILRPLFHAEPEKSNQQNHQAGGIQTDINASR
jgi:hypothetical protein